MRLRTYALMLALVGLSFTASFAGIHSRRGDLSALLARTAAVIGLVLVKGDFLAE
jgi:hypothetical protein